MVNCRRTDDGFTLIELVAVLVVTGMLAAIAIPVFLGQRAKAHDTSTKADVATLGKEVATYFVDGNGSLTVDLVVEPGRAVLSDGHTSTSVNLTNGTAAPTSGSEANMSDPLRWCVALTDLRGRQKTYRYSAQVGLEPGAC